MKSLIVVTALLLIVSFSAQGQYVPEPEMNFKFRKWYIKPAAGVNIPLTKLLGNEITDNLISYDDNSFYWQVISGNYFFDRKWGVELTCQTGISDRFLNRDKRFTRQIEGKYGNRFFVEATTENDDFLVFGDNIDRILIGIVHRVQKRKLLLMPKFLFGITPFYTNSGEAFLKEKGTNQLLHLTYEPKKVSEENFTVAPAVTIAYRVYKKTMLNLDAMYSFYLTDFEYTESLRNTLNNRTQTRIILYDKGVSTLTVGAGLIIEI